MSVLSLILNFFTRSLPENPGYPEREVMVVSAESDADWMMISPCSSRGFSSLQRAELWRESIARAEGARLSYDAALEKISSNLEDRQRRDIEVDLGRSGAGILYCGKTDVLERVLKAYAIRNPTVGYVQGLNMIAAQFLVLGLSEEEAYLGLSVLVEQVASDYYTRGFPGFFDDMRLLESLISKHYPEIYAFLHGFEDPSLSLVSDQNGLTLFTISLPPAALLRVWDRILEHGRRGLVAAQLAVLVSVFRDFMDVKFGPDDFPLYSALFKKKVSMMDKDKVGGLIDDIDKNLQMPEIREIQSFK